LKDIKFCTIPTFQFIDRIIISIDQRWLKHLAVKELTFQASIIDDKLVLVGPKISEAYQNETSPGKEVSNVD